MSIYPELNSGHDALESVGGADLGETDKEYFLGRSILLKAPLSKMAAPRVIPVCPNINM